MTLTEAEAERTHCEEAQQQFLEQIELTENQLASLRIGLRDWNARHHAATTRIVELKSEALAKAGIAE